MASTLHSLAEFTDTHHSRYGAHTFALVIAYIHMNINVLRNINCLKQYMYIITMRTHNLKVGNGTSFGLH